MPDVIAIFESAVREHQAGRLDNAESFYRQVLNLDSSFAKAWNFLGVVLYQRGDAAAGIHHVQRAIQIDPQITEFHSNLGNMLWEVGRVADAEHALRQSVSLWSDNLAALRTLGHALCVLNRCDEAIPIYERALALSPHDPAVLRAQGFACATAGFVHESIAAYRRASALVADPMFPILEAAQLPLLYDSNADLQSWRDRLSRRIDELLAKQVQADVTAQPALPLFQLPHQGLCDRDLMRKFVRLFRPPAAAPFDPAPRNDGKIRVGFISTEFGDHTVGKLARGLILRLNRADFHVTLFSVGLLDDAIAKELAACVDRYIVVPHDLVRARQLICENTVDVLVYTDIGMDATTYSLAFSRLATVQCTTWGHPETTGLETIDYFVSSAQMETTEADNHYTEQLVRLPSLTFAYRRADPSAERLTRELLGLNPQAHLYACPQAIYKFHPNFDAAIAGILRSDPQAQVAIIRWKYRHADEMLRRRFAQIMPDVADRIVFVRRLSPAEFLSFLTLADVLLDPFPYGGGQTSLEGFSLGVPIVTLPTQFLRGRITQAFCRKLGVDACIAQDVDDFVQIAVRLGTDAAHRQQIGQQILARQSALFEDNSAVRDWEQFFREATGRMPPQLIKTISEVG